MVLCQALFCVYLYTWLFLCIPYVCMERFSRFMLRKSSGHYSGVNWEENGARKNFAEDYMGLCEQQEDKELWNIYIHRVVLTKWIARIINVSRLSDSSRAQAHLWLSQTVSGKSSLKWSASSQPHSPARIRHLKVYPATDDQHCLMVRNLWPLSLFLEG